MPTPIATPEAQDEKDEREEPLLVPRFDRLIDHHPDGVRGGN